MIECTPTVLPSSVGYDAVYRLRRSQSTMADDATTWATTSAARWAATRPAGEPLRILSIGCGDGSLDAALIGAARRHGPVRYVGCDLDADSLAVFQGLLHRDLDGPDVVATLVHGPYQRLLDDERSEYEHLLDGERFDVVLLAHVLYYVDDPATAVVSLIASRCAIDGRLVIIHSGYRGVPELVERVLGVVPFVTAEAIAHGLAEAGIGVAPVSLPGRLCIDDAIVDSPIGRALLAFIVERNDLSDDERERLVRSMVDQSSLVDGRRWIAEDLMVMEINSRLRTVSGRAGADPSDVDRPRVDRRSVDALEDYHVLAESFDWVERLSTLTGSSGAAPVVLDVGCGTGRWLRVLAATYPELCGPDRSDIVYDRVDPSPASFVENAAAASSIFRLGTTWCDRIERTPLPEGRYSLIWSVHSLYTLPVPELDGALRRMVRALGPGGTLIVALGDPESFYIRAKSTLAGGEPFTSSLDVLSAVDRLGLSRSVTTLEYVESFDAGDEDQVRRYVWHESIGNSHHPAGLAGGDLPELPSGAWWDGHRHGARYEFAQSVSVLVIGRA